MLDEVDDSTACSAIKIFAISPFLNDFARLFLRLGHVLCQKVSERG